MENTGRNAIIVGIFVIISVTIFTVMLAILAKWQMGKEGFTIDVKFRFLNNLTEGAPVRISGGIPVGYVDSIYQKDLQTYVRLYLDNELKNKIPKRPETQFSIYTTGMMGQKYININIPVIEKGDEMIAPGDVIVGINPPSVDEMMMAFSNWFDGKNGGQVLAEIMKETQVFISNLNGIIGENRKDIRLTIKTARESFEELSGQLNSLMTRLNVVSENFSDISRQNKKDIQFLITNLSVISRDLSIITQRINTGRGSVGKFVNDDAIYTNVNETVVHAKELFQLLKKKPYLIMYKEE